MDFGLTMFQKIHLADKENSLLDNSPVESNPKSPHLSGVRGSKLHAASRVESVNITNTNFDLHLTFNIPPRSIKGMTFCWSKKYLNLRFS